MTLSTPEATLIAASAIVVIIFTMVKLVVWTRSKSPNTEVWGTIFESLTHYIQPQVSLKEPKQEIQKQKRAAGDDKDKDKLLPNNKSAPKTKLASKDQPDDQ
ncbi:MAG: hypothetical protein ACJAR0_003257 [Candidatus Azotimanducaceae bacterium]|jgi:hypothetical protein